MSEAAQRYRQLERDALAELRHRIALGRDRDLADLAVAALSERTLDELTDEHVGRLNDEDAATLQWLCDRAISGASTRPAPELALTPERAEFYATALKLGCEVIAIVTEARERAAADVAAIPTGQ